MVTLKFRYNRRSPRQLGLAAGVDTLFGLLAGYALMYILGVAKADTGLFPAFFASHPTFSLYLLLITIPVSMITPVWFTYRWWHREDQEGSLTLFEDLALLRYRGEEIRIAKGELTIRLRTGLLFDAFTLSIPRRRFAIAPSMRERGKGRYSRTLYMAMERLYYYRKLRHGDNLDSVCVQFYGQPLILGITTPDIFDASPYYVDYDNPATDPALPYLACMVRERANPQHVVGDVGIDSLQLSPDDICEATLRQRAILAIVELDEQLEC